MPAFKNVDLTGDFVNALTTQSDLNLHLVHARITGAITTASAIHTLGRGGERLVMQDAPDLYYLIGDVIETYGPTQDPHGVNVDLDAASHWQVRQALLHHKAYSGAWSAITAAKGYHLEVTVDGVVTSLKPGHYHGQITLSPVKIRTLQGRMIAPFRQNCPNLTVSRCEFSFKLSPCFLKDVLTERLALAPSALVCRHLSEYS